MMASWATRSLCLLLILFLSGCTHHGSAFVSIAKNALGTFRATQEPVLDPAYHYLRVTIGKQAIYLVLYSTKSTPEGSIQTWYSGQGEVVTMQNGRIIHTCGLPVDWSSVRTPNIPSWKSALLIPQQYQRNRDVMPSYRFGIKDLVTRKRVMPPQKTSLRKIDPQQLTWFEEITETSDIGKQIPPARFAVDFSNNTEQVVYSEQCLSANLCLSFQEWNVQKSKDSK